MSLLKFMSRYSTELSLAASVLQTVISRSGMNKTEKERLYDTVSELSAGAARVEDYVKRAVAEPSVDGISREEVASMISAALNAALASEREARFNYNQANAGLQTYIGEAENTVVNKVDDEPSGEDTKSGE